MVFSDSLNPAQNCDRVSGSVALMASASCQGSMSTSPSDVRYYAISTLVGIGTPRAVHTGLRAVTLLDEPAPLAERLGNLAPAPPAYRPALHNQQQRGRADHDAEQ